MIGDIGLFKKSDKINGLMAVNRQHVP